jgi:methionyl-tRNA formyltransferase
MNLIFMGTPLFAATILRGLAATEHKILTVISQPDRPQGRHQTVTPSPVKILAGELHLPLLQPSKIRTDEARATLEPILSSADAIVVAAYGRILPPWILAAPRRGCINVHSSLLPKYRGAAPINWAIARGEKETGVTIMQMDEGLDTGPILLQSKIDIRPDEISPQLTQRLSNLGTSLLIEALSLLERGDLIPKPQDDSQASLAPILKREDGLVDWTMTASQIFDRLRGFTPFPGCYTKLHERRLEIIEANNKEPAVAGEPGLIAEIAKDSFTVFCGGGTQLLVRSVQPEGKRPMGVRDFLNGSRITTGTRLG